MREIYRGNGFVVTTNDSGEIFVAVEGWPHDYIRLGSSLMAITVSYGNTHLELIPTGHKSMEFRRR